MPEYPRATAHRRRRRTSPVPAIVAVAVVLLLVGSAVALTWGSWHGGKADARTAAAAASAGQRASSTPTAPSAAPASSTHPRPSVVASASAAPLAPDAGAVSAADASEAAMRRAAVPFPGAPAISATTPSVNHLNPRHKYVALTLDDGYNFQPDMLKLLQQYDAHCTTFLVGSWAAANKPDLKLMKDAGFEIANHSWTHPSLTKLSSAEISSQLTKTQKVISSVTGNQAPYLRPPFGATDSHVKATAASLGYRIVMWDRTFGDSGRGATPKKLYDNVVNADGGIQPGDVILCHWGSKPSYEALKTILPDLKAQGYEFVTISELIADSKPVK